MAFWGGGVSEPRRNFKFLVDLGGGDEFIPTYTVMGVNLPSIEIGAAEVNFLNHTFHYPGRITYNTITVQLIDAIDEEVSGKILQKISDAGYQIPSAQAAAQTSLTPKSQFGLGSVQLRQLGGGTSGAEKRAVYTLKNTWIKKVDFEQSLEYSSENVSGIALELQYDFFTFDIDGGMRPSGFEGA
jgi:hypothetical protein